MVISEMLTVTDHHRTLFGYTYVYPVVSRRAAGVSLGINLNTNNACNWRCIYCQVPNLQRGAAPSIDIALLKQELRASLHAMLHGSFMQDHVPEAYQKLQDIAFSGNGEPTSAKQFHDVLMVVKALLTEFGLLRHLKVRLISNGSLMRKPEVLACVETLASLHGEVWFKLDAGTAEDNARINDVTLDPLQHLQRLRHCAARCPTFIQTCLFNYQGAAPTEQYIQHYLACVEAVRDVIAGVHLYGVARKSYQPEAKEIAQLPLVNLEAIAQRIRALGVLVTVNP